MNKIHYLFVILFFSSTPLKAEEYSHVPAAPGIQSYNNYLSGKGIANITLDSVRCGDRRCARIKNSKGKVLKTYPHDDGVSKIAHGRYSTGAYLLVSHTYKCGDKSCSRATLYSDDGSRTNKPFWHSELSQGSTLHSQVLHTDKLLIVQPNGAVLLDNDSASVIESPEPLVSARIGATPNQNIAAIGATEEGTLYLLAGGRWHQLHNARLGRWSDRGSHGHVLSVYPGDNGVYYIAAYNRIHVHHKGLLAIRFRPAGKEESGGWLFNSEKRNVGFDPEVYIAEQDRIIIGAYQSEPEQRLGFQLRDDQFAALPRRPPHINAEDDQERMLAFAAGIGFSNLAWDTDSKVKSDDVVHKSVEYDIADTTFTRYFFSGRYKDTRFAVNYLVSQAEDRLDTELSNIDNKVAQSAARSGVKNLLATLDFNGLVDNSHALRIQIEQGEALGIARTSAPGTAKQDTAFVSEMDRYSVLVMRERGYYAGAELVSYDMPSAIGYSDNNERILFTAFDTEFSLDTLQATVGYDKLSYLQRYESQFNDFYLSGSGSLGLGKAEVSGNITNQALTASGKSTADSLPIYMSLSLSADAGYVWHRSFKKIRGLGFSAALGYRVNYSLMQASPTESDAAESDDTLYLTFERTDLLHGPFASLSIVF